MIQATRRPAALALTAAAAALALAGCSKPAPKVETSTTSTSITTTTAATTPVTAGLPSECQAYLDKVSTCMNKVSASNPMAAQFKASTDQARTQWAAISDKAALARVCKQSDASFSQSSKAMGC